MIETPVKAPRKKKADIAIELYAPFARWRTDLLRVEVRCFGARSDSDAQIEDDVKTAMFLAVIREGDKAFGYTIVDRRWPEAAYISIVAIDPEYQGKGYLGKMLGAVEDELRKIGYAYFEIDARNATLASKIEKHYADRIKAQFEHGSNLGPMTFFRVLL